MEKQYTIQEIRNMLNEMEDNMNIYEHIDAANGLAVVQSFLEFVQIRDAGKSE